MVDEHGERFPIRAYTMVGIRADADVMLWKVSERLEDFQELATALHATALGPYLETPYAYLSMTRRSQYVKGEGRSMHKRGRIMWDPGFQVPADLSDGQDPRLVPAVASRPGRGS